MRHTGLSFLSLRAQRGNLALLLLLFRTPESRCLFFLINQLTNQPVTAAKLLITAAQRPDGTDETDQRAATTLLSVIASHGPRLWTGLSMEETASIRHCEERQRRSNPFNPLRFLRSARNDPHGRFLGAPRGCAAISPCSCYCSGRPAPDSGILLFLINQLTNKPVTAA